MPGGTKLDPYGQEISATGNDKIKFATYLRDGESALDYAMNRYYSSGAGRLLTADPYLANNGGPGDPSDPPSWNRYSYTRNNPVNRFDPSGWCDTSADTDFSVTVCGGDDGGNVGFDPSKPMPKLRKGDGSNAATGGGSTECALSLWETPILVPGTQIPIPGLYHTALVITIWNSSGLSPSQTFWLEAYPDPQGGTTYLNSTGAVPAPGNRDPSLWTVFHNYGASAALCTQYNAAVDWASNYKDYKNDTIQYNNMTTNSNTWTWSLLQAIGLPAPTPPGLTPGWGHPLP